MPIVSNRYVWAAMAAPVAGRWLVSPTGRYRKEAGRKGAKNVAYNRMFSSGSLQAPVFVRLGSHDQLQRAAADNVLVPEIALVIASAVQPGRLDIYVLRCIVFCHDGKGLSGQPSTDRDRAEERAEEFV